MIISYCKCLHYDLGGPLPDLHSSSSMYPSLRSTERCVGIQLQGSSLYLKKCHEQRQVQTQAPLDDALPPECSTANLTSIWVVSYQMSPT